MANNAVRLDRWLWAARFYKTRAAASQAIDGGKVDVNDARAKRAKLVRVGDRVRVRRSPFEYRLTVRALSEHRGPARMVLRQHIEKVGGGHQCPAIRTCPAELRMHVHFLNPAVF